MVWCHGARVPLVYLSLWTFLLLQVKDLQKCSASPCPSVTAFLPGRPGKGGWFNVWLPDDRLRTVHPPDPVSPLASNLAVPPRRPNREFGYKSPSGWRGLQHEGEPSSVGDQGCLLAELRPDLYSTIESGGVRALVLGLVISLHVVSPNPNKEVGSVSFSFSFVRQHVR